MHNACALRSEKERDPSIGRMELLLCRWRGMKRIRVFGKPHRRAAMNARTRFSCCHSYFRCLFLAPSQLCARWLVPWWKKRVDDDDGVQRGPTFTRVTFAIVRDATIVEQKANVSRRARNELSIGFMQSTVHNALRTATRSIFSFNFFHSRRVPFAIDR